MKGKRTIAAVASLAWTATALGAAAQTTPASTSGEHLLKLTNTSKGPISAVYAAPAGSTDFSDDLLGKQVAGAGRTVRLKVGDPKGTCVFDVQFLLDDGSTVTRKGVNLCQTEAYAFSR